MPKKPYWLYLSFLIVSIVLMTYQDQKGKIRPLGFLSHPLNSLSYAFFSMNSSFKETVGKFTLREKELEELRNQIRELKRREQAFKETLRENQRLSELLFLKERQVGYIATARIIARGSDRWANTFVIDKGTSDGIEKGMAAVTPEGLLGKIQEVDDSYSTVLLIDDLRFSAAVRLQTERTEAIVSGAGPGRCVLKYVSSDIEVRQGEVIITSGLDALFPPGIEVGYISHVSTTEDALFHTIEVTPFVDTRKVEEVIVVKR